MDINTAEAESGLLKKPVDSAVRSHSNHNANDVIKSMPLRFGGFIAVTILLALIYMITVDAVFKSGLSLPMQALMAVIGALVVAPVIWYLILHPVLSAMKKDQELLKRQQDALEDEMQRHQLNNQLGKAFSMAESESDIIKVFERVVARVLPEVPVELLLADSSRAHLRLASSTVQQAAATSDEAADSFQNKKDQSREKDAPQSILMCNVASPRECIAARQGIKQIQKDSLAIDACPILIDRGECAMSAVCVPINIAGTTVGVIHSDIASDKANIYSMASTFSIISSHLGNRLGLVKAMDAAQQAAMTDPLTGLLNRRSLEDRCETLLMAGRKFAVIVTDIDHFKKLNDTYSHAVGDRSLKAFSRTLQKSCRAEDIVARLGGEEFCIVLADVSAENAVPTLERVQRNLPGILGQSGLPEFTASFGVTDTDFGDSLETLIKIADNAMYDAKKAGRNRIVVASAKSKPGAGQKPAQLAS